MSEDIFISGLNVEDIKNKQHLHYVYGVCFPGSARRNYLLYTICQFFLTILLLDQL